MKNVLYLGPKEAVAWLEAEMGPGFTLMPVPTQPTAVKKRIGQAHVILDASMKIPLSSDLLASARKLELVITATTGANHIDAGHLKERSIPVLTLKGEKRVLAKVNAAAELSWALLMACARRLKPAAQHVEEGEWERTRWPGPMLRGKKLGIVGLGRNGSWCARYGLAFGMDVAAYDPYASAWPESVRRMSLESLVRRSDFLMVHATYSDATHHLLDARLIARCKVGAIWVNTSRDGLWDERALVLALRAHRLLAVGADVLYGEPDITGSELWKYAQSHDNVLLTPHIGGYSPDALEIVMRHTGKRIRKYYQ